MPAFRTKKKPSNPAAPPPASAPPPTSVAPAQAKAQAGKGSGKSVGGCGGGKGGGNQFTGSLVQGVGDSSANIDEQLGQLQGILDQLHQVISQPPSHDMVELVDMMLGEAHDANVRLGQAGDVCMSKGQFDKVAAIADAAEQYTTMNDAAEDWKKNAVRTASTPTPSRAGAATPSQAGGSSPAAAATQDQQRQEEERQMQQRAEEERQRQEQDRLRQEQERKRQEEEEARRIQQQSVPTTVALDDYEPTAPEVVSLDDDHSQHFGTPLATADSPAVGGGVLAPGLGGSFVGSGSGSQGSGYALAPVPPTPSGSFVTPTPSTPSFPSRQRPSDDRLNKSVSFESDRKVPEEAIHFRFDSLGFHTIEHNTFKMELLRNFRDGGVKDGALSRLAIQLHEGSVIAEVRSSNLQELAHVLHVSRNKPISVMGAPAKIQAGKSVAHAATLQIDRQVSDNARSRDQQNEARENLQAVLKQPVGDITSLEHAVQDALNAGVGEVDPTLMSEGERALKQRLLQARFDTASRNLQEALNNGKIEDTATLSCAIDQAREAGVPEAQLQAAERALAERQAAEKRDRETVELNKTRLEELHEATAGLDADRLSRAIAAARAAGLDERAIRKAESHLKAIQFAKRYVVGLPLNTFQAWGETITEARKKKLELVDAITAGASAEEVAERWQAYDKKRIHPAPGTRAEKDDEVFVSKTKQVIAERQRAHDMVACAVRSSNLTELQKAKAALDAAGGPKADERVLVEAAERASQVETMMSRLSTKLPSIIDGFFKDLEVTEIEKKQDYIPAERPHRGDQIPPDRPQHGASPQGQRHALQGLNDTIDSFMGTQVDPRSSPSERTSSRQSFAGSRQLPPVRQDSVTTPPPPPPSNPCGESDRCSSCGNVFMPDSVFCRKCGKRRQEVSGSRPSRPAEPSPRSRQDEDAWTSTYTSMKSSLDRMRQWFAAEEPKRQQQWWEQQPQPSGGPSPSPPPWPQQRAPSSQMEWPPRTASPPPSQWQQHQPQPRAPSPPLHWQDRSPPDRAPSPPQWQQQRAPPPTQQWQDRAPSPTPQWPQQRAASPTQQWWSQPRAPSPTPLPTWPRPAGGPANGGIALSPTAPVAFGPEGFGRPSPSWSPWNAQTLLGQQPPQGPVAAPMPMSGSPRLGGGFPPSAWPPGGGAWPAPADGFGFVGAASPRLRGASPQRLPASEPLYPARYGGCGSAYGGAMAKDYDQRSRFGTDGPESYRDMMAAATRLETAMPRRRYEDPDFWR